MSSALLRVIYVSRATVPMNASDLDELLEVARVNNQRHAISGVLTFHEGAFLQVLEGPEDAVEAIFSKIMVDDRHDEMILVERTAIDDRVFAKWAMGWVEHVRLLRIGFDLSAINPADPSAPMIKNMLGSFETAIAQAA